MRFVIDETSWRFDKLDRYSCIEALETMLDQLDDAHDQGHSVCYSEDLFSIPVWQDKSFYDLYEPDSQVTIPWEVRERIATLFGRLPKWQELSLPWPPVFEVQLDQGPEEYAPSIAWAHEQMIQDKACAVACLVFPHGRSAGHVMVTVNGKECFIWFVADHKNY